MSAWRCGSTAAVLVALAGANGASAQDYEARSWAASCASCHGTEGRSESAVPALAGRSKVDLVAVLMEFKSGQRKTATIMHQYAVGYSDQQLERIADYFSRQPR
jgi:cytochrome c553